MATDDDKPMEQRYLEDVVEAVERVLAAPLPIVGDRAQILGKRVEIALSVLHGTTHPADVQVAPLPELDQQLAAAFGPLRAALSR